MHRKILSAVIASVSLVAAGCDDHGHPHDEPKATNTPASTKPAASDHGHDHGPGADHAHDAPASTKPAALDHGHDHGPGADHAHGTPAAGTHDLGTVTVAEYALKVTQTSPVTAGKEADFALTLAGGTGEPKAIRLWIGVESAEGSTKVRTHKHGSKMEAHVEVPNPIPAGAKLWIEVETTEGRKAAAVAFK
jgi:hypothetical protein